MDFYIEPAILEKFPHLKVGVLIIKGVDNRKTHEEIGEIGAAEVRALHVKYANVELNQVPKIADWRAAYKAFGYKPSSYRCSAEALLKRVMQGKDIPDINPIVNLYNLISLKYTLPAGADDLDQVDGSIRLAEAKGGESFVTLGSREEDAAKQGEII